MSEKAEEYSLPVSEEIVEETQPVREAQDNHGITREDFENFANRIDDKLNRFSQSLTDRTEDRVKKALDGKMKQLDAFFDSSSVAPEDQETIRKQVRAEVLKEEAFKAVKQEPEPAKRNNNAEVEAVNRRVTELLDTMGVQFKDGDKELEMIVHSGSAKDYEKSVIKAATQWLVRKNSDRPNPEARIPGIVSGSSSEKSLKAEYDNEIKTAHADPINGLEKVRQIRRKYRELGLSV